MTPAEARSTYRRTLQAVGETITIRRMAQGVMTQCTALARYQFRAPTDSAGGIQQRKRIVIVLAEDVERSGFPLPFRSGLDHVLVGPSELAVTEVDDLTRQVAGVVIAYELTLG